MTGVYRVLGFLVMTAAVFGWESVVITKQERKWIDELNAVMKDYIAAVFSPECICSSHEMPNCSVAASFYDKYAIVAEEGSTTAHGREGIRAMLEQGRTAPPYPQISVNWYYTKGNDKAVAAVGLISKDVIGSTEILEKNRILGFFRKDRASGKWIIQYIFELKGDDLMLPED